MPIHKKGDKQTLKNYRPVSLLPICGKIFERLIYNEMFGFFLDKGLISDNQSGFKPGDSCINQLLSITHNIYKSFDDGYEVRGVFLDISKAFYKVWHDGLIFKLQENGISGNLLNVLKHFLTNRKQRVVLNGQSSSWTNVKAGVPQGSILGPLLFLIYINDLADGLSSNTKLFADVTSLLSVIHDSVITTLELNSEKKLKKCCHPSLRFNNNNVSQASSQKHLGLTLDNRLTFDEHLTNVSNMISKTIGLLQKLQNILPRPPPPTIYKCFIRPHLDYGDIIYDKAYNLSFHQKLESIQYNAAFALTGVIRGSSREKLYQELGLESLQLRRWYKKLCSFYKIYNKQAPGYLTELIPTRNEAYQTRHLANIPSLSFKHNFFKNTFFPSTILEWNKLDPSLQNSTSYNLFKNSILKFIRPSPNKIFQCHNPKGIKLVTRLRLGLSHLREHKFKHSFQDTLNPLCICGVDIETTSHYFLHCPLFHAERSSLLNNIN